MKKAMKWKEFLDKLKLIFPNEELETAFGSKEIDEKEVVRLKDVVDCLYILPNIIVEFKDKHQSFILKENGKDKLNFKKLLNKKVYDFDFDFLKSGNLVLTLEMFFWR